MSALHPKARVSDPLHYSRLYQTQQKYVFAHASTIACSRQLNRALRTPFRNRASSTRIKYLNHQRISIPSSYTPTPHIHHLLHQKTRISELLHRKLHSNSWRSQLRLLRLLRLPPLQHLHRYPTQYHQSVRISLLRHSISHQTRWRNYQPVVHLHPRLHLLEHLYQNTRNLISLSMT